MRRIPSRPFDQSQGLNPVPVHRWHFTFLLPFFKSPFPSQFLHFTLGFPVFFCMPSPVVSLVGSAV